MLGQVATLRSRVTRDRGAAPRRDRRRRRAAARSASPSRWCRRVAVDAPADIAIVGIASVLPKANTTREYWQNILDKVDAITEIPSHRWDWRLYFDADRTAKDKIYSKWGGFLDDMAFDPMRYGMPPKSITSVDPMQLMALEVARQTIEDAGYHEKAFDRERASVIVGASGGTGDVGSQYGLRSELPRFSGALPAEVAERLPEWTEDSFAGILLNVIAGRVANRLNFGGVNFTIDAACASSLAAVYQGVTELVAGRSDFVVAGGVDTVQGPFGYLCFSKTQALSPRGRCSTFDASGDGIVISEGIAMVALKRLADAERDGDRIYAVIKGVGGGSDGNAKGLTAPLPAGQLRAMRRAYEMAGFGPASVGLFEAHGTGTVAGDSAELQSTTELIGKDGVAPRQAAIGSVKTMIGHTKATAGIAGLIKAALALHHRVLPPHRGVDKPNPILAAAASPLYLLDQPHAVARARRRAAPRRGQRLRLRRHQLPRRDGGVPRRVPRRPRRGDRRALAGRAAALERRRRGRADGAARQPARASSSAIAGVALRDLAASLAGRWSAARRDAWPSSPRIGADLIVKLGLVLARLGGDVKPLPPGVHHGVRTASRRQARGALPRPGLAVHRHAARAGACTSRLCAGRCRKPMPCCERRSPSASAPAAKLSRFIFPRAAYSEDDKARARQELTATDVAQPALGAVEVAMFRLMQTLGVAPDMLAGHSYGEFVALFAAGAIDFEALMTLSAARGRFIVDAAEPRVPSSAPWPRCRRRARRSRRRSQTSTACSSPTTTRRARASSPDRVPAIAAASAQLAKAGHDVTEIPVAAAFHSSLVQPAQRQLAALIEATPWQPGAAPGLLEHHGAAARGRCREDQAAHGRAPGSAGRVRLGDRGDVPGRRARLPRGRAEGDPQPADGQDPRPTGRTRRSRSTTAAACAGLLGGARTARLRRRRRRPRPLFDGRACRVGDPERIESLLPPDVVPKHAWLLNGSYARRADEPVRQIGVTLEQAGARSGPSRRSAARAAHRPARLAAGSRRDDSPGAHPGPAPAPRPRPGPCDSRVQARRAMDQRRPPPGPGDPAVMAAYFETMRQFLETQERVMAAYLAVMRGRSHLAAAAQPQRCSCRAMPSPIVATPVVASEAGVAEVAAAPTAQRRNAKGAAQATHGGHGAHGVNGAKGVNGRGRRREWRRMASNGVNGVEWRPRQPNGANGVHLPVAAADRPQRASARGVERRGQGKLRRPISREKLTEMLLGIVEEKTGYPRDMVGLDQNLESDLGIDSIKRIEVVGAMLQFAARGAIARVPRAPSSKQLNTQPTLEGMLGMIGAANGQKEQLRPF